MLWKESMSSSLFISVRQLIPKISNAWVYALLLGFRFFPFFPSCFAMAAQDLEQYLPHPRRKSARRAENSVVQQPHLMVTVDKIIPHQFKSIGYYSICL